MPSSQFYDDIAQRSGRAKPQRAVPPHTTQPLEALPTRPNVPGLDRTSADTPVRWAVGIVDFLTNRSTGYCPEPSCFAAVSGALADAGFAAPPGFSHEFIFRRCPTFISIVKEADLECATCGSALGTSVTYYGRRRSNGSWAGSAAPDSTSSTRYGNQQEASSLDLRRRHKLPLVNRRSSRGRLPRIAHAHRGVRGSSSTCPLRTPSA